MNGSPQTVEALNDLPIKTQNGATIYMRDVAHVRDGYPPQTNIVRSDGQRGALMTILKTGNASTLDIIAGVRKHAAADRRHAAAGTENHAAWPINRSSCARPSAASCARRSSPPA